MRPARRVAGATLGLALVAAPFAAHAAIAEGEHPVLASALSVVQVAVVTAMAWRSPPGWPRRVVGAAAFGLLALLAARMAWPILLRPSLVAVSAVSHALIYGSLLVLFGQSLRPGRTDLVTGLAVRLDNAFTPAMRSYTRGVTWAWCAFFAGQLVLSGILLLAAPRWLWSLDVNVLDGPSVFLLFAGEYLVRRLRFRSHPHVSPWRIVRSYSGGHAG